MNATCKINADAFESLLLAVRDNIASLRGCQRSERDREATLLQVAINELCAAQLVRKNDRLLARRRELIAYAGEVLANA